LEEDDENDLDPSDYNLKLLKDLVLVKNNKGQTPLLSAVDEGVFGVFRLLLDLSHFYDTQQQSP